MPKNVPNRLLDRLEAARYERFVGRDAERALFESALTSTTSARAPFSILHLCGPSGIGKTTLLREFARLCATHQTRAVFLDARELEANLETFETALSRALETSEKPLQFFNAQTQRHVLFIDTYERLAPLDNWLRETFLPQLPGGNLVALAGRNAPRAAWELDAGWSALLRVVPLQNLSAQESHTFLQARHVPLAQHNRVLDFTHGHPLALSLVADAFDQGAVSSHDDAPFDPQNAPGIVRLLVAHLVDEVPSPRHRAALEACALVRWTTEPLLAHLLEPEVQNGESAALFEWLCSLSFVESGALGLCPHDMAREALVANLRWRNPQNYALYHRRARTFYASQLKQAAPLEQQKVLADYIYLHHDNSVIRPFWEWQENGDLTSCAARENDLPVLSEMVRLHEGDASAQLFEYWFERQRASVLVLRGNRGVIEGFLFALQLHQTTEDERAVDVATRNAWRFLQCSAPLRRGEGATIFRFWMARETYQNVSPAQSLVFVNVVRHYLATPNLATPNLAFTFFCCENADFWKPAFDYAGATRSPEADFQLGARAFGVYSHDWRRTPPLAWLDQMAENEIAATASANASLSASVGESSTRNDAAPVLLSEDEFAQCVRDALKNLARLAVLAENSLLRSRFLSQRADAECGRSDGASLSNSQKIVLLQKILRATCERLCSSRRTEKWYQALRWRYLEPAATQELAAEKMDVPFSTFRRYLKWGIERVVKELWREETDNSAAY